MPFTLRWTEEAAGVFHSLQEAAEAASTNRSRHQRSKSSKQEGLFKQIEKCVRHLAQDPRHPGLVSHVYTSLAHPYEERGRVFESYAQNNTPGAYRVFWCYGPGKGEITLIAITPHS